MTYEQIFNKVKESFIKAKTSNFKSEFAFQFNITGEGEGIFYAAYKNGIFSVEPYDYKDNDVIFSADAETFINIASGKLSPTDAVNGAKLFVDGNRETAKQLVFLVESDTNSSDNTETIQNEPAANSENNTNPQSIKNKTNPAHRKSSRSKTGSNSPKRNTKRSKAKKGSSK